VPVAAAVIVSTAVVVAAVPAPVALFVSLESLRCSATASGALAVLRNSAVVAMLRVEVVIHMAMEVIGTVKPWTDTNECTSAKPLWAIVSIGGTAIGSVVIVAVGTCGCDPDADA
jgi:ABC-type nickel/cobalt efflux system permease component RcnA